MNNNELSEALRQHARTLSPTVVDRNIADMLFGSVQRALGGNCYLVGSFARYTATRPLHDIDILFVAGVFQPNDLDPRAVLQHVRTNLERNFRNPTQLGVKISVQTHSVTITLSENSKQRLSIDIVPGFQSGEKNASGDDIFWVPEILNVSKGNREARYEELAKSKKREVDWWIRSDPLGYIKESADLNARNADFRKTVKLAKAWKNNCRLKDKGFPLKSFHLEQAIFEIYRRHPNGDVSSAVFDLFCDMPSLIAHAQIRDKADETRLIDQISGGPKRG